MAKRLLNHLKRHAIAYVALSALLIALTGSAYAAVKIPQLTRAHQTAKAGITCTGTCPASNVFWAYIGAHGGPGALPGAGPNVYQTPIGGVPVHLAHLGLGDWLVFFESQDLSNCVRFANLVHDRGSASVAGFDNLNPDPQAIHVLTSDAQGNPADLDFDVIVFCANSKGLQTKPAPPAAGSK